MIENIINTAKTYILGERVIGEKIPTPKVKTVYPDGYVRVNDIKKNEYMQVNNIKKNEVDHKYNDWCKTVKFSSMYSKPYSDY